jgi:hypothetical protein
MTEGLLDETATREAHRAWNAHFGDRYDIPLRWEALRAGFATIDCRQMPSFLILDRTDLDGVLQILASKKCQRPDHDKLRLFVIKCARDLQLLEHIPPEWNQDDGSITQVPEPGPEPEERTETTTMTIEVEVPVMARRNLPWRHDLESSWKVERTETITVEVPVPVPAAPVAQQKPPRNQRKPRHRVTMKQEMEAMRRELDELKSKETP